MGPIAAGEAAFDGARHKPTTSRSGPSHGWKLQVERGFTRIMTLMTTEKLVPALSYSVGTSQNDHRREPLSSRRVDDHQRMDALVRITPITLIQPTPSVAPIRSRPADPWGRGRRLHDERGQTRRPTNRLRVSLPPAQDKPSKPRQQKQIASFHQLSAL